MNAQYNLRRYGRGPFTIALIHGGPGAAGEMQPAAEELSKDFGTLEPLQTADSVDGQVEELRKVLEQYAAAPANLVGSSWGAWLAYILAAKHPELVKKLILVGSGPFEAKYAGFISDVRLSRLNPQEKKEAEALLEELEERKPGNQDALEKFGRIIAKADSYDPMPDGDVKIEFRQDIYLDLRPKAGELRKNGELLRLGKKIKCPVVAIHGDYDPHPADGVRAPLAGVIKDFHVYSVKKLRA